MKNYNFDKIINRKGTFNVKWEYMPEDFPKDSLPLWVADMDFECAEPILEALHERVDRQIFGYTEYDVIDYKNAVIEWFKKRFDWDVLSENIYFSPGIVPAIGFFIRILTNPGDGIVIQPPVYHPFNNMIKNNSRKVIKNPLIYENGIYKIDYIDLEIKFRDNNTKGIILCSPHNPVGRVWKKEELEKIVRICEKYDKWIISDEIHFDLLRKGIIHHPLEKVCPHYKDKIFTCTSPSKSFNIAGLYTSNIIINNHTIQEEWIKELKNKIGVYNSNPFGMVATIAAYNKGEQWLNQVLEYIDNNINYVIEFVKQNLPEAKVVYPEGTYLIWLDLNNYVKDSYELEYIMKTKAKVALDEGYIFGEEGKGFERINVACPRSILADCMQRIATALNNSIIS